MTPGIGVRDRWTDRDSYRQKAIIETTIPLVWKIKLLALKSHKGNRSIQNNVRQMERQNKDKNKDTTVHIALKNIVCP